jgi:predicted chitinase/chitodextrinase
MTVLATIGAMVAGIGAAAVPVTASSAAATCFAAYNNSAVYTGGMQASYNAHNWTAKWWTQYEAPSTGGSGVWTDNGDCGGGGGGGGGTCTYPNWAQGAWYPTGSIVRFTDGLYYIAEHDNPGYDPTISTWFWDPFTCGGGGGGGNPPPTTGGFPVSEAQFNQMFPSRIPFYTYAGLVNAAGKFSSFVSGDDTAKKREAAAFLANIDHESGQLRYVEEIDRSGVYCDDTKPYGCPAGRMAYYGRGPIQLSWNFNYKSAGDALGLDLLNHPEMVANDASISYQTAVWYWMTQNGPNSMPAHQALFSQGFGGTIRSINGSLECDGRNPGTVQNRVAAYQRFAQILGVDPGGNLYC